MKKRLPSLRSLRSRSKDVAGFVLAGGQSSRMGRDKALLELGSLKLIEWARLILNGAGLEVWIAGARSPELQAYAPVVADVWPDAGPLGGVCSALRQIERDWAVFVPVDLPLMAPALVIGLLEDARTGGEPVTVASVRGVAQTFPAVVRRDVLAVLGRELEAGRSGCLAAFRTAGLRAVPTEEIATLEEGSLVDQWFWNVNTPEDLARMQATLRRASWSAGGRANFNAETKDDRNRVS